jgi:hypothetical protein
MLTEINMKTVPDLDHYGISRTTGFMPSSPPLKRLPAAFEIWESLIDDLSANIMTGRLRRMIKNVLKF